MKLTQFLQAKFSGMQPESLVLRRAFSTALAIFVAVVTDRYVSLLQQFWVPMTTVLVLQMTIRATFRQEVLRFGVVISSVFLCSLIYLNIHEPLSRDFFVVSVFVVGCFIHELFPANSSGFSPPLMVAFIALMMLVPFTPEEHIIFARIHDVLLGGVIAITASIVIFPGRPDLDFRAEIIPILQSYIDYLTAITNLLFRQGQPDADAKKIVIEEFLQTRRAFFPDWVYEPGFNPGLRQGHRHFLIRVEQAGEVLFAMHHAARYAIDPALLDKLQEPIRRCINDSQKLMANLVIVLSEGRLKTGDTLLPDDILDLEEAFRQAMPLPFELLDMSPDYVHLAGFIYDLNDLQNMLLVLAESLRAYISVPPSGGVIDETVK